MGFCEEQKSLKLEYILIMMIQSTLPNAVVTPMRKVATYEPRIKEKLYELGKSKRITGH